MGSLTVGRLPEDESDDSLDEDSDSDGQLSIEGELSWTLIPPTLNPRPFAVTVQVYSSQSRLSKFSPNLSPQQSLPAAANSMSFRSRTE